MERATKQRFSVRESYPISLEDIFCSTPFEHDRVGCVNYGLMIVDYSCHQWLNDPNCTLMISRLKATLCIWAVRVQLLSVQPPLPLQ